MSPLAILWLLLSDGDPTTVGDRAANPTASTPAVEIVLAGPREGRAKMEATIRAVTGAGVDLGWSHQDSLPTNLFSPDGRSGLASGLDANRIGLDLCEPAELRVYLPAAEPQGAFIVRTVWRPDGDAEDGDRVAREEVAQIVKTAVLALQGRSTPKMPPPAPIASSVPVTSPSNPPAVVASRESEVSSERRLSPSFLLGGGIHTDPWDLGNDIGQDHWLGPSLLGAVRWHMRRLQLGLRLAWERSEVNGFRYDIKSDLLSATLAGAYRFSGRWLSLSLGLQAGALVLHQDISSAWGPANSYNPPGHAWAAGPIAGPVLEVDFTVSQRIFLHLDAAVPAGYLRIDDGITRRWTASAYVQTTLGLGFHL